MTDLNIISDGAVLIRDGVIEEVGATRRVENLVPARSARVIDATGRIVMPGLLDPDIALAASHAAADGRSLGRTRHPAHIATPPRSRGNRACRRAGEIGDLTVGAHTLAAPDLQNTGKACASIRPCSPPAADTLHFLATLRTCQRSLDVRCFCRKKLSPPFWKFRLHRKVWKPPV